MEQMSPVRHHVPSPVDVRHQQGVVARVCGVDGRPGQVAGDRDRDGAAAGTHVRDLQPLRRPVPGEVQNAVHEKLGLLAWDKHAGADREVEPVELPVPEYVRQRFTGGASFPRPW